MSQLPDELTERAQELAETILSANYPSQSGVSLVLEIFASESFAAGWRAGAEAMRDEAQAIAQLGVPYTPDLFSIDHRRISEAISKIMLPAPPKSVYP